MSSFAPFFTVPSAGSSNASTKVHMSVITDWINNLLVSIEPNEGLFKLNNLNKCIATKMYSEM